MHLCFWHHPRAVTCCLSEPYKQSKYTVPGICEVYAAKPVYTNDSTNHFTATKNSSSRVCFGVFFLTYYPFINCCYINNTRLQNKSLQSLLREVSRGRIYLRSQCPVAAGGRWCCGFHCAPACLSAPGETPLPLGGGGQKKGVGGVRREGGWGGVQTRGGC